MFKQSRVRFSRENLNDISRSVFLSISFYLTVKAFFKRHKIVPVQDTFLRVLKVPVAWDKYARNRSSNASLEGSASLVTRGAVTVIGRFTVESSDIPK